MEILGQAERNMAEIAKAAMSGDQTPERYRELYAMHNPLHPAMIMDAAVIQDRWLGRLTGIAATLAATVERLAAEVERERSRADQAENCIAEIVALADDAIVAAVHHAADDSAAWGVRS
jgi:hypothetical protein